MYQIVLCNCPNDEVANNIATRLVSDKLAACVNIMPKIKSVYRWQDEVHQDVEIMMLIKTKQALFSQLEKTIEELHPYDVVEVIALSIQQGNELYLNWINENCE